MGKPHDVLGIWEPGVVVQQLGWHFKPTLDLFPFT